MRNEKKPPSIESAAEATGFEKCDFGGFCEKCEDEKVGNLWFGNQNYFDAREGDLWCGECVLKLHMENLKDLDEDLHEEILEILHVEILKDLDEVMSSSATNCERCQNQRMLPGADPDGDVFNEPCPSCNEYSPHHKSHRKPMKITPEIRALVNQIGSGDYRDGSSIVPGVTYHPLPFPELVPSIRSHKPTQAPEELDLIRSHKDCGIRAGCRVLDVGANVGFYSVNIARDFPSVAVDAVEADPANANLLSHLVENSDLSGVSVFQGTLQEFMETEAGQSSWDVMLMLNVHMWIYKQLGAQATDVLMWSLVPRVREMYFQTAHKESQGMHVVEELKTSQDVKGYLEAQGWLNVEKITDTRAHGGIRTLFRAEGTAH